MRLSITELPREALLLLVRAYRFFLKPWLGNACRFEPTCSQYALDALQRHGAIAGGTLTVGRLLRCQPWCDGGCDPVPARAPGLFTRLGGEAMLIHLASLWAVFVVFTLVFANDDPRRARLDPKHSSA